jgi:hypothetical protein
VCDESSGYGFIPGPGEVGSAIISGAAAPAALAVGGMILLGMGMTAVAAGVADIEAAVDAAVYVLTPVVQSIAAGIPAGLLLALVLTLRERLHRSRGEAPALPLVAAEPEPERCWQCPVRAVPRAMLDSQIPATGTYVTDPDFELVGAR